VVEINPKLITEPTIVQSILASSPQCPDFSGYIAILTAGRPFTTIEKASPLPLLPLSRECLDIHRYLVSDTFPNQAKRQRTE
jgi:hypothetical protein